MLVRAAGVLVLVLGCGKTQGSNCDPDDAARELAGSSAVDCGIVAAGADPTAVDTCAADAVTGRKAFRAHFEQQGIDSRVIRVIAGTADGKVFFLSYDGDPSGGGGAHPTLDQSECVGPLVDRTTGHRAVGCASMGAPGRTCS
jgi:hypothetical protein